MLGMLTSLLRGGRFFRPMGVAFALGGLLLAGAPVCRAAEDEDAEQAQNAGFEEGATAWSLPATFGVVEDVAHSGKRSLRVVNPDAGKYLMATQKLTPVEGMQYRFSVWVKTQGVKGSDTGATVCLEWYGEKGYIGGSYPGGFKGDHDWGRIESITPPIPKGVTSFGITLYLRQKMTGTAWFDDVSVRFTYPPALDAALVRPNYRGRLSESAADQSVVLRAHVSPVMKGRVSAGQATLVATLLDGEKVVGERRIERPGAGAREIALDARKLKPGDYRARVELLAPNGKSLGMKEFPFRKLAADAPAPTVWIDDRNRTLIKGKPFFPLGWYFGPGPGDADFQKHLDRLAAGPFNTVMCYGINGKNIETVRAYLDALNERNLKLIYSIKDVYENTSYFKAEQFGAKGEDAIVRTTVGAFREHPALLAWYLNDELPLTMRDRLEARQQLVQELDPNHPTWSVLYQVSELAGYLGTADVLGTDPYPLPERPAAVAGEWTRTSAAASGGHRPLWQVPQAFDWGCYHKDDAGKYRAPTLAEERVMTYLCLINGAHGLIYYSYFDLMRDRLGFDKRWADMLLVGNEVKALEPALLSAQPAPKVRVEASGPAGAAVQWMARADEAGTLYVLLANPDPKSTASVRVAVVPGTEASVLNHNGLNLLPPAKDATVRGVTLGAMDAATLVLKPAK